MKAMGPDGIPSEFYKEGGEKIQVALVELFEKIDEEEQVPLEWNKVKVKLIIKGGRRNKMDIKNYRPIAVADTISNIYWGIKKEKIREVIEGEGIISEEQNGFRKDRRGTENIYIIKEIIEERKRMNQKLYCAFLDIEKAYDTVHREILWKILEKVGLNTHIINLIKSMYRNTVATYDWKGLMVEEVKSERGLRQGCTLSPMLFTLIMEELVQRIKGLEKGIQINQDILGVLVFADDVVVLAENREDLQQMLDEVGKFSLDMRIKFGTEKCKVLKIDTKSNGREENKVELLGTELEFVEEY